MLTITESAINKAREYRSADESLKGKNLRIFIEGGGCSGFQYGITFDDKKDDDQVVEAAPDLLVVVDPNSLNYLKDSQVDYQETMTGAGFHISNPNVKSSCGCGNSFNV